MWFHALAYGGGDFDEVEADVGVYIVRRQVKQLACGHERRYSTMSFASRLSGLNSLRHRSSLSLSVKR